MIVLKDKEKMSGWDSVAFYIKVLKWRNALLILSRNFTNLQDIEAARYAWCLLEEIRQFLKSLEASSLRGDYSHVHNRFVIQDGSILLMEWTPDMSKRF